MEAGQVLAADRLGKWKTAFQLSYLITGLVWLTAEHAKKQSAPLEWLGSLARPSWEGGWLQPAFLCGCGGVDGDLWMELSMEFAILASREVNATSGSGL